MARIGRNMNEIIHIFFIIQLSCRKFSKKNIKYHCLFTIISYLCNPINDFYE